MRFKVKQWEYLRNRWRLTPREVEVAKLVCDGYENEDVAKKLHIAYNTVRAHLGHRCNKVGVRGKADLIIAFDDALQRAGI